MDRKLEHPQAESPTARVRRRERIGVSRRRTAILEATAASAEGLMNRNEPEKGKNAFLARIGQAAEIVNASLDLDQTLSLLLEQLASLVPYDSAAVFLHEGKTLHMAAARGFPGEVSGAQLDLTIRENPLLRHVVETRKPLMLTDAQQDERFQTWGPTQRVRSWIAAPLLLGTELVGILTINHHQPGAFDDESTRLAQALTDQTAVAIYKARLVDDLQRANRELRRLDELKDQFIQNVAHELRTPLTLVRGYVELLAQEDLDLTTQNEAIQTALNHTETLVQLVEAITTLQDLSLEGLTLDPVDLTELIATAHQMASQKALRAGIELRTERPAKLPAVTGDFIWLSQALYQLLDNAIKFSPPGGHVTLGVRDDTDAQELHISVEDQGIGVPADEQQRIFELFYQADGTTTRRFGGTGLGLAIVKHVVQAHGGRVWVESPIQKDEGELGSGSRFNVSLPRNGEQPLPNAPV